MEGEGIHTGKESIERGKRMREEFVPGEGDFFLFREKSGSLRGGYFFEKSGFRRGVILSLFYFNEGEERVIKYIWDVLSKVADRREEILSSPGLKSSILSDIHPALFLFQDKEGQLPLIPGFQSYTYREREGMVPMKELELPDI